MAKAWTIPLRTLWVERSGREGRALWPDEGDDTPGETERAWLPLGVDSDGTPNIGLGRAGGPKRGKHRPLGAAVRTQARRRGLDRERRRLVDLHHGEDETLYRVDGLEADEIQDMVKVRVVAHIMEPRGRPIQTQYVFRPGDTQG